MNILPKKSWHVRNIDNIERVKKDEARAADEEKKQLVRAAIADRESRTKLLRERAQSKGAISFVGSEVVPVNEIGQNHVNFFTDLEKQTKKGNKDYEAEKKSEQEAWEKKVGILTHLGQSVTEGQYKTLVDGLRVPLPEVDPDLKKKDSMDPLNMMKKYLGHKTEEQSKIPTKRKYETNERNTCTSETQISSKLAYESHISKSRRHHSSHGKTPEKKDKRQKHKKKHKHKRKEDANREPVSHSLNIQQLRAQRLKREEEESKRTARFLSGESDKAVDEVRLTDALDGRYNSQFHPHLARQRFSNGSMMK